ncbi:hypothetical protein Cgig2_002164 [Carnegiea gigantea]|uniref:NPF family transporter n=1 Tax=Carnegiea gigantea TaxID=171969 RepID=A0A9Q1QQJ3_9CARY|nr:hypothetical protein Cgig2_002164 [Carnegiea gigantea]
MILYLTGSYGLEMATGANIIFFWSAATNFTPILGAFLADTFAGRFRMIGFGSILSLMVHSITYTTIIDVFHSLGMTLLWSTTTIPGARPPCYSTATNGCNSPTPFQLILLCSTLGLMSMGSGGIRSSTLAFGADQLVRTEEEGMTPSRGGLLGSFFNWYYFSVSFAVLFALTCEVYIQDHVGWQAGFGVPLFLMFLSVISFFLASSFYVKAEPKSSLFTGFAQVIVASWRNRHSKFSTQQRSERLYHVAKGSTFEKPSEKLRFLNKACLVKDPKLELTLEGAAVNPSHLCTVDQVEEFKSVLRIIPLWSTAIILGVNANQTSFRVLQANSMDRHILSSSFEIPAGSFGTFALITIVLWLVLYDRVFIPWASKVKGKPTCLDAKTRMGIGFLLSIASLVVAALVESIRRDRAIREGTLSDYPSSKMSALWLVPQICLLGLAEALCAIAQIEFFYSEFPKSMSSISSNLWGLAMSVASLVASLIMSLIDHVSKQWGQHSWVSGDVNKGHYDYYYGVLAGLSLLNYMYFLLCSRGYWQDEKVSQDTN